MEQGQKLRRENMEDKFDDNDGVIELKDCEEETQEITQEISIRVKDISMKTSRDIIKK